ncbi:MULTISPECIES: sensor histidine kinase [unclassified Streptomyces]|uniref:sensor histidine kinase n=1 Tax=unclassified Streptomyces TaxID=2593676 RepID=UPI0019096128|nr:MULTISPECIES: histidine kinase [unclassified Streptomyces]MBK3563644.1 sensor histidine kinase [Streptomyces sp. MBT62]MBK6013008.1 sensor histidine kinase [Streptomyces sp. MBT53]
MLRLIETLSRLQRGHPWLTDALLVVLVAVPPVIRPEPGWRPVWVQAVVYVALVLPLLWRRRRPVLVAALVTAVFWAQYLGHVWGQEPGRGAVALAAALATLTVRGLRRAAAVTVLCAAGCVLLWIPAWQRDYDGGPGARGAWLTPLAVGLLLAGAWVFGEYVRARRAYVAEFERRAALAESERLALARVAVAEERARIAREIHDVLAHSVSVMVLNAEGGRLMRQIDPAVVDRTLGVISATGREALGELRRLLEVLRTPDTGADSGSAPDGAAPDGAGEHLSADLRRLIGRLNTSGRQAQLDLRGEQDGLPPDLTAQTYRIVQEALTNVVKHAPPDATVHVRVDTGSEGPGRLVRVRVENSPGASDRRAVPPPPSGRGLTGMRERTALYGGRLDAGPTPDGGYRVVATLRPAEPEPTAATA